MAKKPEDVKARGGCSSCDMRGPVMPFKKASKHAQEHGRRIHGNPEHPNLYLQGDK